jgi:SAM-dependent methyltransferase
LLAAHYLRGRRSTSSIDREVSSSEVRGLLLADVQSPTNPNPRQHRSLVTPSLAQQQFRLPRGIFGRLAGWYMSRENRHMNKMAVDWLDVQAGDDVLEIGFGPGHGLELILKTTPARSVFGLDPSSEMAEQALARNQTAADAGRLRLFVGAVETMPFADAQFSRVVAISNFHVWPSREKGLREIYRVLRPEGKLVICLRRALENPWPWSSPGLSPEALRNDQALLETHGFHHVQFATRKQRRRNCCLMGTR